VTVISFDRNLSSTRAPVQLDPFREPFMSAKKQSAKAKHGSAKSSRGGSSKRSPEKDPKGGLTAAGREAYAKKEGAHLRPGVKGPADTPEKMKRKGSFLTRHFTHPRGPMIANGNATRLALSAHAWGEPIPKTMAAAARLAAKGRRLLDHYRRTKEQAS
jgi:hypothetical protein